MRQVTLPTCSWCHRTILSDERAVSFPCPNCGRVTIWRCRVCRELARPYVCPSCGFEGP